MIYREYVLRPTSSWMTPWQSDTLFGHISWAMLDQEGEQSLQQWLASFDDAPALLISDGFIGEWLPRPLLPSVGKYARPASFEEAQLAKRMKGQHWIHRTSVLNHDWGNIDALSKSGSPQLMLHMHNTINRLTGTSLERDGLYEQEAFKLPKGERTISIYIGAKDEAELKRFDHYIRLISLTGYGKRKTVGQGQFEVQAVIDRDEWFNVEAANALLWLSHGVPSERDSVAGQYKLATKYGKIGEGTNDQSLIFKKPLTRICPGAVFLKKQHNYAGTMVHGISDANSSIVQYAYSLTLPLVLEDEYIEAMAALLARRL